MEESSTINDEWSSELPFCEALSSSVALHSTNIKCKYFIDYR